MSDEIRVTFWQVAEAVRDELVAVYETDGQIHPDDFDCIGSEVAGRLTGTFLAQQARKRINHE